MASQWGFQPVSIGFRFLARRLGAFQSSSLFHHLAGGNTLTLTEGHRSDMGLFNFHSSLIAGGERFAQPVAEVLESARAITGFEDLARHNLCISHNLARRILLNQQLNKAFLPEGVTPTFIRAEPKKGQMCAAQSLFIWPGIALHGVRNNVLYRVTEIEEDTVIVVPAES